MTRLRRYILACLEQNRNLDYRTVCAIVHTTAYEADAQVQRICAAIAAERASGVNARAVAAQERWRREKGRRAA